VHPWQAIRARRNVRPTPGRATDPDTPEHTPEAARRTPTSMNHQAWDFVVVTDRERLQDLSKVWRYAEHVATSAATVALVAPASADPDERETFQFDLGQASMSIMLTAADRGSGSCHAAVADRGLAQVVLGLPAYRVGLGLISRGHRGARRLTPMVRPSGGALDDVVHRERW
jgi:nitroreductase